MGLSVRKLLNSWLRTSGYEIARTNRKKPTNIDLRPVIGALAAQSDISSRLTLVQVGANDGITKDPVASAAKQYADVIVLIEPQQNLISRLRQNYADYEGDLRIKNIAVSKESHATLYMVSPDLHGKYVARKGSDPAGVASFDREHVEKHLARLSLGEMASAIVAQEVECLTLDRLIRDEAIKSPVFLQVDCEGYDWEVLQTLGGWRPEIINFEAEHLDGDSLKESVGWLRAEGYTLYFHNPDCLAIRHR